MGFEFMVRVDKEAWKSPTSAAKGAAEMGHPHYYLLKHDSYSVSTGSFL
jgi:hypothetical protein